MDSASLSAKSGAAPEMGMRACLRALHHAADDSQRNLPASMSSAFQDAFACLDDSDASDSSIRRGIVDKHFSVLFEPFRLCLESDMPALVSASLQGIERLLAYHFIDGAYASSGSVQAKLRRQHPDGEADDPLLSVLSCCCRAINGPQCSQAEDVQLHLTRVMLTSVTRDDSHVHGKALVQAFGACFQVALVATKPVILVTARTALQRMAAAVVHGLDRLHHMQSAAPSPVHEGSGSSISKSENVGAGVHEDRTEADSAQQRDTTMGNEQEQETASPSLVETDIKLVFKPLCRNALKPVSVQLAKEDEMAVRSHVLSLETLNAALQAGQTSLGRHPFLVSYARRRLVLVLLQNAVSPVAAIAKPALSLFGSFLNAFKRHVKAEIKTFFTQVFLRLLESQSSSPYHKSAVLGLMSSLCKDPVILSDMFVNFDCELSEANVFQRSVAALTKVAQLTPASFQQGGSDASSSQAIPSPHMLQRMQRTALEALVSVAVSLKELAESFSSHHEGMAAAAAGGMNGLQQADLPTTGAEETGHVESTVNHASLVGSSSSHAIGGVDNGQMVGGGSPRRIERNGSQSGSALEQSEFVRVHARKKGLEGAIERFNVSIKRGLSALREGGWVSTPLDMAQLVNSLEGFDKEMTGELMGEPAGFGHDVMFAFMDLQEVANLSLDAALRKVLSKFRLPGEAQKIDRMMEKFAERYCDCNEGAFASADTAYVLAYSIIMLNTDAHNPQVKNKMTLEAFLRNNRGINDGNDLDSDFLTGIYNRIVQTPFQLGSVGNAPGTSSGVDHVSARDILLKARKHLVSARKLPESVVDDFKEAQPWEAAQAMVETVWAPLLAAFSVVIEHFSQQIGNGVVVNSPGAADPALAIEGLRNSIAACALCGLDTERDALLQALIAVAMASPEFTGSRQYHSSNLGNDDSSGIGNSGNPMVSMAINAILEISLHYGKHLGQAWTPVTKVFAMVDRMNLAASGHQQMQAHDRLFLGNSSANSSPNAASVSDTRTSGNSLDVDGSLLDHVFSSSGSLSDECIVHFVQALTDVARDELFSHKPPRVFAMQRLVEVAAFNMSRIRIVWSRLWYLMGPLFADVIISDNDAVAQYAADSLRQLSFKFLDIGELPHFMFQRDFLKPFDMGVLRSGSAGVRELLLHCMVAIVQSRASALKSGWKNVLACASHAAKDSHMPCRRQGLQLLDMVLGQDDSIQMLMAAGAVSDAVVAVISFAEASVDGGIHVDTDDEGRRVIVPISTCLQRLSQLSGAGVVDDPASLFPVLTALGRLATTGPNAVRDSACTAIFDMLDSSADSLSEQWWEVVFRGVLLPLFDDVRSAESDEPGTQRSVAALGSLIELLGRQHGAMHALLHHTVSLLSDCIRHPSPSVSVRGATHLRRLAEAVDPGTGAAVGPSDHEELAEGRDVDALSSAVAAAISLWPPQELLSSGSSEAQEGSEGSSQGASPGTVLARRVQRAFSVRSEVCRLIREVPQLGSSSTVSSALAAASANALQATQDSSLVQLYAQYCGDLNNSGESDSTENQNYITGMKQNFIVTLWNDWAQLEGARLMALVSEGSIESSLTRCRELVLGACQETSESGDSCGNGWRGRLLAARFSCDALLSIYKAGQHPNQVLALLTDEFSSFIKLIQSPVLHSSVVAQLDPENAQTDEGNHDADENFEQGELLGTQANLGDAKSQSLTRLLKHEAFSASEALALSKSASALLSSVVPPAAREYLRGVDGV